MLRDTDQGDRLVQAKAVRDVELRRAVRRACHPRCVATVVRISKRNDIVVPDVSTRHQTREIVGFRACFYEIAGLEIPGIFAATSSA